MIYIKKKSWFKKISNVVFKKRDIPIFSFLKILKIVFLSFLSLLVILYFSFIYLLPQYIKEENIELALNSYFSKNTKLSFDIDNIKIKPNYKFDINIKADKFRLKYPNNSDFLILNKIDIDLNVVSLIFGYIDFNKIQTDNVLVYTDFTGKKTYSCFDYIDAKRLLDNSNKSKFKIRNFNFNTNKLVLNLFDKNVNKKFILTTNGLKFLSSPSFDFKSRNFEVITSGQVKSLAAKIFDFNLRLNFKTKNNSISKINSYISKLTYNPLVYADEYKFYSNVDINLKIAPQEKRVNIDGAVKLLDYTFMVNGLRLPKNNLLIIFNSDKIIADCDFNFIRNQYLKIKINANTSKNKFIELKANSNNINLSDFKDVLSIFYKILNIKFNSDEIKLNGNATLDLYLKSDFKKIVSSGRFEIKNASLLHKKTGLNLENINSNINLQNSQINILNTSLNVGKSKFYVVGKIDDKTNLDIRVNSDVIDLASVVNLAKSLPLISSFVPVLDDYVFKNGLVKISALIKGNFKTPLITTNSKLEKVCIFVKSLKSEILVKEILLTSKPNNKVSDILVQAINLNIKSKNSIVKINKANFNLLPENILIQKTNAIIDGINVTFEGEIKNYKQQNANIILKLVAKISSGNKFLIVKSNDKKDSFINLDLNIIKEKLIINNGYIISNGKKAAFITGEILNYCGISPLLNNVKILIQDKLSFYIPLNNISFDAIGNVVLNGKLPYIQIDGNLNLYNLNYRDLNLYVPDLLLNIKNSSAYINIVRGRIFGFDFDLISQLKILKDKIYVDYAQINSNYINLDALNKYMSKENKFNLEVSMFRANIMVLETMDMLLNSVYIEGNLKDNILFAKNFKADLFKGNATGSFIYEIKNNKTKADVILKEINVRLLTNSIKEIKSMSIAASGKLSALIKAEFCGLDFDSILKTFDGYVKFNIDDGELSQFAKLERFLQAGNILSQSILKLTLNSTLSAITNQNTGDFKTIEGTIKIKNSLADIQYIKTQGTNMSLYLLGKFNIMTQDCNMEIYGKIPYQIVNVLGPIGKFSTEQIVNKMSDDAKNIIKSLTVSPLEKMLSEEIPQEYISKIPPLAYGDNLNVREFKVRVVGNSKNPSSVRYFKWRKK